MFIGFGTLVNVCTVLIGGTLGLLVGHRLPPRTRSTVTTALGLVTVLIALKSAWVVSSSALATAVGSAAPMLIVLGSLLVGGILGSLLDVEARLESLGGWLRHRLVRRRGGEAIAAAGARARFVEGFVASSLIFCVGPLTILGSLSDGLGLGAEQLLLKATLDGFAAIAFAASFGAGVLASALAVAVIQGALTLLGFVVGDLLPPAHLDALTATGGLVLLALGLRLLEIKAIPAGNLLPALLVAPLLTQLVAAIG